MIMDKLDIKQDIIAYGKRLYQKGFCEGTSGNISVKIDQGCLVTCSGSNLGNLGLDDVIYAPFESNCEYQDQKQPTSELPMHIELYKQRPDVKAIVHAHSPYATAVGISRQVLNPPLLPEVIILLGEIQTADYDQPSTWELAKKVAMKSDNSNGIIMANHGAVTLGQSLKEAYYFMETLESYCKTFCIAKQLGNISEIPESEIEKLKALKQKY